MNDSPGREPALCVAKRDGSVEPFDPGKMVRCISLALVAGGDAAGLDNFTARTLAEAIFEYLRSARPAAPVPARHLLELVETVLLQTGHTDAGVALRQYAAFRDRQRRRLMVAAPRPSDGRFLQRRWNKAHLVRHLRRLHSLDTPASRMIAGRVEQLVFGCGLRVVTSGLVREMARSELLAWGLLNAALAVKRPRPRRDQRKVRDGTDSA